MSGQLPLSQKVTGAIRTRMSAMDMTARDLSRRCGIAQTTLSRWLRDQGAPSLDDLQKIADALATTPEKLMKGVTR